MAHKDKRKVSTDALETLGMIHTKEEKRDAIHLAVLPVEAGENLDRGTNINVKDGIAFSEESGMGIVDPFLERNVKKGEKFWMVIKPRVITSLRHVWTHPNIEDETPEDESTKINRVKASEKWLREYSENGFNTPSYDTLIERAIDSDGADCLHFYGEDAHGDISSEFWHHLEIVTGVKIQNPPNHFSCSC